MTQSSTVALFQILHMHHTLGYSLVDSGCICSPTDGYQLSMLYWLDDPIAG